MCDFNVDALNEEIKLGGGERGAPSPIIFFNSVLYLKFSFGSVVKGVLKFDLKNKSWRDDVS